MFKYITSLLFFSLLLFSCNQKNTQSQPEERTINDHTTDNLCLIAIGDAKFGMTSEELKNTEVFKDVKYFTSPILFNIDILSYGYEGNAKLANDTLYKVILETQELKWDNLDYLNKIALNLKSAFVEKYGEPDFERSSLLQINDLSSGKTSNIARWEIGEKQITVGIYSFTSKPYYKVRSVITHRGYEKIAEKQAEIDAEEKRKDQQNPL